MLMPRESFSDYVRRLLFGRNVRKSDHMLVKRFSYGVIIEFNILRTLIEGRTRGDLNRTGIISIKKSRAKLRKHKLTQKPMKLDDPKACKRYSSMLRLGGGFRNSVLFLTFPKNECIA